ncbi:nucleotidyltransferase family protein [Pelobium manganitolerans]|uniref:nucleotidyltransferase family protein n=1 Tax=Pelobium manganitolerans TaxID=1842495 RepID=UPI003FA3DAB8
MKILDPHKDLFDELCEVHKVEKMYLFGSAVRNNFRKNSDLDFLVRFKTISPPDYFDNFLGLKDGLEKLFKRNVDLLEEQAIRNPVLMNSINRDRQLVYG